MFQLTKEEFEKMKSDLIFQNGTSSWGGTRKLPYAFTEQGLAMLSGVLNSDTAIEVNIAIMRAFVAVRQPITTSPANCLDSLKQEVQNLKAYIEEVFTDLNDINEDTRIQLELINRTLAEMQSSKRQSDKPRNKIGFK